MSPVVFTVILVLFTGGGNNSVAITLPQVDEKSCNINGWAMTHSSEPHWYNSNPFDRYKCIDPTKLYNETPFSWFSN